MASIRQKTKEITSALDMPLNEYMERKMTMEQAVHGDINNVARDLAEENAEDLLIVSSIAEKILQAVKNQETDLSISIAESSYNVAQCLYAYQSEEHEGTPLVILSKHIKNAQPVRKLMIAVNATEQDSQFFLESVTKGQGGSIKSMITSLGIKSNNIHEGSTMFEPLIYTGLFTKLDEVVEHFSIVVLAGLLLSERFKASGDTGRVALIFVDESIQALRRADWVQ